MNTRRAFAAPSHGRAWPPANRNLPWRDPGVHHARRAPSVAGNSPVPARVVSAGSLESNLPIASATVFRPSPRLHSDEQRNGELRRRFRELADRWCEETEFHSTISARYLHPAYQEVIGMGPDALPLLLEDLAASRSDWFWALRAISGENPVPSEERGQINRMTERWLSWGHEHGFL